MSRRLWGSLKSLAFAVTVLIVAACGAATPQPTVVPFVTPGPPDKTVNFWDIGLSLQYPHAWGNPQFIAGQMTFGPSANSSTISQIVIAVRIINNAQELKLPTDASLDDIAHAISGGSSVSLTNSKAATFADLDTISVDLNDTTNNLYGIIYVFRLPDSRIGALIAATPHDLYADYAPIIDAIRGTVKLLKPADFAQPALPGDRVNFPAGKFSFQQPGHWVSRELGGAQIYHVMDEPEYADQSGFTNGLQLVVRSQPVTKFTTLRSLATQSIQTLKGDVITDIKVGGQPGVEIASSDTATGQVVTFVAVASQDHSALTVFRWTVPGMLVDVARPTLNKILESVQFVPAIF